MEKLNDSRRNKTLVDFNKFDQMKHLLRLKFPKGRSEINRDQIKDAFWNNDIFLENSNDNVVQRWISGQTLPHLKLDDVLYKLNCYSQELLFKSIDDCVYFENIFLGKTLCYTRDYVEKNFPDKMNFDEFNEQKIKMEKSADNFYFSVVRMAINAAKHLDPNTMDLIINGDHDMSIKDKVLEVIDRTASFISEKVLWKNNVFGLDQYSDIYISSDEYDNWSVNQGKLITNMRNYDRFLYTYFKSWNMSDDLIEIISVAMESHTGQSFIAGTDQATEDIPDYTLDRQKHNEEAGIYMFGMLGRFNSYMNPAHDTLDWIYKDAEIIAANNWYALFESLAYSANDSDTDDPHIQQLLYYKMRLSALDPDVSLSSYNTTRSLLINSMEQLYVSEQEYYDHDCSHDFVEKNDIMYRMIKRYYIHLNNQYYKQLLDLGSFYQL